MNSGATSRSSLWTEACYLGPFTTSKLEKSILYRSMGQSSMRIMFTSRQNMLSLKELNMRFGLMIQTLSLSLILCY